MLVVLAGAVLGWNSREGGWIMAMRSEDGEPASLMAAVTVSRNRVCAMTNVAFTSRIWNAGCDEYREEI